MDPHWIWDSKDEHPRNYWACFRKTFDLSARPAEAALSVFADSRYVAYVNGTRVGQGPARSWPTHPYVDTYPVTGLLREGANVIAILVHHFGYSTMQYIEAEACLTAELAVTTSGATRTIGTDQSWKTLPHAGYARAAIRNYPQQGWSEIFDANRFPGSWTEQGFDDSAWAAAVSMPANSPVWKRELQPRDIPLLREDLVYPARVHGSRIVVTHGRAVSIDLRAALSPREDRDMNEKTFVAGLATVITAEEDLSCDLQFPWSRRLQLYGSVRIDGTHYRLERDVHHLAIRLKKGPNLFIMDLSGLTHSLGTYFRFATDVPLTFTAPVYAGSQFAVIGPYEYRTIISVGIPGRRPNDSRMDHDAVFSRLADNPLAGIADMERLGLALRPVSEECVCDANLYDSAVNRETLRACGQATDSAAMIMPNADYTTIERGEDGLSEVTVDFGRELSGYLEIELTAARGTMVDLYGIECIREDGTIEHTDGIQCTLRYVAREGWQVYRSPIRRGLRYVQITIGGIAGPVRFHRIAMHNSSYAAERVGSFDCSDKTLTRVWEMSRDTDLLCMEDTFVDCPCYEQTFWVGDARGEALVAYYTFGAYDFVRHGWELAAGSLDRSPITESQVPSGWQNVLSTWSLFWMVGCKEYYDFSGDEDFLRSLYPSLRRNVEGLLERVGANDLLAIEAWNMLDWAPMDTPDRGVVTHLNAGLTRVLRELAWLARIIGRDAEATEMEERAGGITRAINRHLWNEQKKAYIDSIHADGTPSQKVSMQTNIMVYLCDCAEGKRRQALERYLRDPPPSFVQIGSPFVTFFYYQALAKAHMIPQMLADIRKNYGMMLDEGATSCWETFPGFEKGRLTRSHCHAWSAAPAFVMGGYVLGVRPLEPGFTRTIVDPDLGDLAWAKGSVPTPHGRIDIRCEKRGTKVAVKVRAPAGVQIVAGPNAIIE